MENKPKPDYDAAEDANQGILEEMAQAAQADEGVELVERMDPAEPVALPPDQTGEQNPNP